MRGRLNRTAHSSMASRQSPACRMQDIPSPRARAGTQARHRRKSVPLRPVSKSRPTSPVAAQVARSACPVCRWSKKARHAEKWRCAALLPRPATILARQTMPITWRSGRIAQFGRAGIIQALAEIAIAERCFGTARHGAHPVAGHHEHDRQAFSQTPSNQHRTVPPIAR